MQSWLQRFLPKPKVKDNSRFGAEDVDRIVVLTKGKNPTYAYYLEERLTRVMRPVVVRDVNDVLDDIDPDGTFIILCRYVWPRHLFWLWRNRNLLAGCSLLIDDDLVATVADTRSKFSYRAYILFVGILPLFVLNRVLTHIWVSTPALSQVLQSGSVMEPLPPENAVVGGRRLDSYTKNLRLAFHATGSHAAEHEFLLPILEKVAYLTDCVDFEITADGQISERWMASSIPKEKLHIVPTQPWENYCERTRHTRYDVVLVPLLRSWINDVRADTKRIDICRMGACGVFSHSPVYARRRREPEILLSDDQQEWTQAILRLLSDPQLRSNAMQATCGAVEEMRHGVYAFPGLEIWFPDGDRFVEH